MSIHHDILDRADIARKEARENPQSESGFLPMSELRKIMDANPNIVELCKAAFDSVKTQRIAFDLETENAKLRAILKEVEFAHPDLGGRCPLCESFPRHGHASYCKIGEALK